MEEVSRYGYAIQSSNSGLSQKHGVGRWVCRLPFPHKLLLLSLSLQTLTERPVSYKQGCVTFAKWLYLSASVCSFREVG